MRERDRLFIEASERYREKVLHQGSIACVLDDPMKSRRDEKLRLWQQYRKIERRTEIEYPVYRKVRRYAATWRKPRWHHFYDELEIVASVKRVPFNLNDLRRRDAMIVMTFTGRVTGDVRVPIAPKMTLAWFEPFPSSPSAIEIHTDTFTFPTVSFAVRMTPNAYEYAPPKYLEYVAEDAERQIAQKVIEGTTITCGNPNP